MFYIVLDIYVEDSSRASRSVLVDEKDEMIQTLQYQLEKQKRKQFRQEQVCYNFCHRKYVDNIFIKIENNDWFVTNNHIST